MTPEEVVGRRIQLLRGEGETPMTQEDFGQRLGEHLGKPWSKQTVSAAEKGLRAFRLQELLAIARVLGTTIRYLMRPITPEDQIEISEGQTMTAAEVEETVGLDAAATELAIAAAEAVAGVNQGIRNVLRARLGPEFVEDGSARLMHEWHERIAELEQQIAEGEEKLQELEGHSTTSEDEGRA